MPHYSRLELVAIDVPEDQHDRELAFWQGAIGKELPRGKSHPEFHGALLPHHQHFGLLIQRLADGQARMHLDIHTDDVAAEVARLEALGASQERRVQDWYVMRDPAGLLFCVVPVAAGSLNDDNAQRWE